MVSLSNHGLGACPVLDTGVKPENDSIEFGFYALREERRVSKEE